MIGEIKNIIELFLDKSKHWTLRTGIFISVIGILFILNFTSDISYNYYVSRKLENLEKIQILKKDYCSDTIKLKKIVYLENKIMNKKHYSELIFSDFSLHDFSFSSEKKIIIAKIKDQKPTKIVTPKATTNSPNIPSYFWMFVSSNCFFLLIFVILIFLPLFGKDQRTLKSLTGWFAGLVSFSLIMFVVTWIAFKIPILFGNPIYNYILNGIIQTIFIAAIVNNSDKK